MTRTITLARHPLAIIGVIVTTASAVVFITLMIAMLAGMFTNPYAGLVVFIGIPAVFVIGLLLIPAGMWLERRKQLRDPTVTSEWPVVDFRRAEVRRTALVITALTAVNIVNILLAGGGLHAMETPGFCGQTCHTPMHPQFEALRGNVHSGVACVQCHIGDGAAAFVNAKLSGVRQLVMVATNSYPMPVPPGANMPPGKQAETCKSCHTPGRVVGDRIRVIREYADDEANTETMTVLQMHMSVTKSSPRGFTGSDPSVRVDTWRRMRSGRRSHVRVTDAKGWVRVRSEGCVERETGRSTNDGCVDCHNMSAPHLADTGAGRRSAIAAMVATPLCEAREHPPREGDVSHAGAAAPSTKACAASMWNTSADPQVLSRTVGAVQEVIAGTCFPR